MDGMNFDSSSDDDEHLEFRHRFVCLTHSIRGDFFIQFVLFVLQWLIEGSNAMGLVPGSAATTIIWICR